MDNQRIIIGAGLVAAVVLITKSYVTDPTGLSIHKPLIGIAVATILLAGMDVAGLGEIAAPLAILMGGTVVVIYALPLIVKVNEYL